MLWWPKPMFIALFLAACQSPNSGSEPKTVDTMPTATPARFEEPTKVLPLVATRSSEKFRELIDWVPRGNEGMKAGYTPCDIDRLWPEARQGRLSRRSIEFFLSKCFREWDTGQGGMGSLIKFSSVDYHFEKTRYISSHHFQLKNGKIIRGLLALKPDGRPRPLVIAACGVLCNVGNRMSLYLLMQLFDETPFHALILSNATSMDFLEDNHIGGFGGINGGDTIYRLARFFRDPANPWFDRISSVHAFGISLGSHEALYAGQLSQNEWDLTGRKALDSVTTTCSVVDHPQTASTTASKPFVGSLFNHLFEDYLKELTKLFPWIYDEVRKDEKGRPDPEDLNRRVFAENQSLYESRFNDSEPWHFPKGLNSQELVEFARFQNHIAQYRMPTLLLGSANDPIVSQPLNVEMVIKRFPYREHVSAALAPKGSHCATPLAYGWRNISRLFQLHILNSAPEFSSKFKRHRLVLNLRSAGQVFRTDWKVQPHSEDGQLLLWGRSPSTTCDPESSPTCYRLIKIPIPLADVAPLWGVPETKAEAEALRRWLNVQLRVEDAHGLLAVSSGSPPSQLVFWELQK